MSKKDKSKFKKLIKAQISEEMLKAQNTGIPIKNVDKPQMKMSESTATVSRPAPTSNTTDAMFAEEINLSQIKYDLNKTGIVVACLAVMIAILYYLDLKHSVLLTFGTWLFKVLHIG